MYQISNSWIIFFLFSLLVSHSGYAHARPNLTSNQELSGEQMMMEKQEVNEAGLFTEEVADFKDLIGEEDAYQKRRMVEEAHLDYIYTQTHKP